jgi:hypothetical protein
MCRAHGGSQREDEALKEHFEAGPGAKPFVELVQDALQRPPDA